MGADGELLGAPWGQLVIVLAFVYSKKIGLPEIKWKSCALKGGIIGLAASLLVFLWGLLVIALGFPTEEQPLLLKVRAAGPLEFSLLGIVAGIFGPFVEELYFRGWWQSLLIKTVPAASSIMLVAFVFALLHGSAALLPGLWLAGCLFGFAAYRCGLTAAIVAHAIFNCVTIVAARSGLCF